MNPEVQALLAKIHKTEPVYTGDVVEFSRVTSLDPCCVLWDDEKRLAQGFVKTQAEKAVDRTTLRSRIAQKIGSTIARTEYTEPVLAALLKTVPLRIEQIKQQLLSLLDMIAGLGIVCENDKYFAARYTRSAGESCKDFFQRVWGMFIEDFTKAVAGEMQTEIDKQINDIVAALESGTLQTVTSDFELKVNLANLIDKITMLVLGVGLAALTMFFPGAQQLRLQLKGIIGPMIEQLPVESWQGKEPEAVLAAIDPQGKLAQAVQIAAEQDASMEDALAQVGGLA